MQVYPKAIHTKYTFLSEDSINKSRIVSSNRIKKKATPAFIFKIWPYSVRERKEFSVFHTQPALASSFSIAVRIIPGFFAFPLQPNLRTLYAYVCRQFPF